MTHRADDPTNLTRQIQEIVNGTVSVNPGAADPLAEHELDSIGIIQLLAALEDRFRITIPPEDIQPANFRSVASLVEMIQRLTGP